MYILGLGATEFSPMTDKFYLRRYISLITQILYVTLFKLYMNFLGRMQLVATSCEPYATS